MGNTVIFDQNEQRRRVVRIAQGIMLFADGRLLDKKTYKDFSEIGEHVAADRIFEAAEIAGRLVRQVLPLIDISRLSDTLRHDVLCEFAQMRATLFEAPLRCDDVRAIFMLDGAPIMAEGRVGGKDAWITAIPDRIMDRENWLMYLVMVPDEKTAQAYHQGDICTRKMTLAEGTAIFTMAGPNDMTNMEILQGPICEEMLCDEGLYLSHMTDNHEVASDDELLSC